MNKRVLIPLPSIDFDPTEAGVAWKMLSEGGIEVVFSTPGGKAATSDFRMITGQGLGIWSPFLRADANGLTAYNEMRVSSEFLHPSPWIEARSADFAGVVLPGGHAPGMKDYLESEILQKLVTDFFLAKKLVGAICHGVVLAARSKNQDGMSILWGYKTTALLQSQELAAWAITCFWLKNYYRTYDETVQSEVVRNLADPKDFISGPTPLKRDSSQHLERGFIVKDRNLITARWPGDAHLFGKTLVKYLDTLDV